VPPGHTPVKLAAILSQLREAVLVCGHSHIPWQQAQEGRLALNPGAVGSPGNGDVRAQYAVLSWHTEGWQVEHHTVSYDLDQVRLAYQAGGLLAAGGASARAFLLGIETGQPVLGYFASYVGKMAAAAGYASGGIIPDEIWDQAVATFNWEVAQLPNTVLPLSP